MMHPYESKRTVISRAIGNNPAATLSQARAGVLEATGSEGQAGVAWILQQRLKVLSSLLPEILLQPHDK